MYLDQMPDSSFNNKEAKLVRLLYEKGAAVGELSKFYRVAPKKIKDIILGVECPRAGGPVLDKLRPHGGKREKSSFDFLKYEKRIRQDKRYFFDQPKIDPSYKVLEQYSTITRALAAGYNRFSICKDRCSPFRDREPVCWSWKSTSKTPGVPEKRKCPICNQDMVRTSRYTWSYRVIKHYV